VAIDDAVEQGRILIALLKVAAARGDGTLFKLPDRAWSSARSILQSADPIGRALSARESFLRDERYYVTLGRLECSSRGPTRHPCCWGTWIR